MTDHPPMQDKQILSEAENKEPKMKSIAMVNTTMISHGERLHFVGEPCGECANEQKETSNQPDTSPPSQGQDTQSEIRQSAQSAATERKEDSSPSQLTIPTPAGEERESAQEFATHYVLEKYPKEAIKSRGFAPSLVIELMEAYASRRIAALQQTQERTEYTLQQYIAIDKDLQRENAELRKRMGEK